VKKKLPQRPDYVVTDESGRDLTYHISSLAKFVSYSAGLMKEGTLEEGVTPSLADMQAMSEAYQRELIPTERKEPLPRKPRLGDSKIPLASGPKPFVSAGPGPESQARTEGGMSALPAAAGLSSGHRVSHSSSVSSADLESKSAVFRMSHLMMFLLRLRRI